MEDKTVPHAYPMSVEYEFANPTRIFDQNFGEGKQKKVKMYLYPYAMVEL